MTKLFDVDPVNKLGNADWGEDDDFASFIDALNRGGARSGSGVASLVESPSDFELDAVTLAELKSKLAGYR